MDQFESWMMGVPIIQPTDFGSFQPYQVSHDRSHRPSLSPTCHQISSQLDRPCAHPARHLLDPIRTVSPEFRYMSSPPEEMIHSKPEHGVVLSSGFDNKSSDTKFTHGEPPQEPFRWIGDSIHPPTFARTISDLASSPIMHPRAPSFQYHVSQPSLGPLESFDEYHETRRVHDSVGPDRIHNRLNNFAKHEPYWIMGPKSDRRVKLFQGQNPDKARRHVCPVCDKRFNRPSSLNTHMSVHTGAKPFVCEEPDCGRRFSVSSNLRRHEKTHQLNRTSPTMHATPSTTHSIDRSDNTYSSASPPLPFRPSTPFFYPYSNTSSLATPPYSYPTPLASIPVEYTHHPQLLTPLPTGAGTGELEQYRLGKPRESDDRVNEWYMESGRRGSRVH